MFKLAQVEKVWWPVVIQMPVDGGKTRKHEIQVQFHLQNQDETDQTIAERTGDAEFFCGVILDWKQVCDEDGQPIEFSIDACRKLVKIKYVRAALVKAYQEASYGAAAKN